jgi:hypothetical protein
MAEDETPPPRSEHDYYRIRRIRAAAYASSINEYNRLVTWISGGALGLSITFVEKLSPQI